MVAAINRGNFNEGLGNELETSLESFELGALVNPTLDIGRFIPVEQVVGSGKAFAPITNHPLGTQVTVIRIAMEDSLIKKGSIYIRKVRAQVCPNSAALVPTYTIAAGAARVGTDTIIEKVHFNLERSGLLAIGDTIVEQEFSEFSVPRGMDYIIRIFAVAVATIRDSFAVEAVYLPPGVNGSKC